jgi:hypothetical protein
MQTAQLQQQIAMLQQELAARTASSAATVDRAKHFR